MISIACDHGAYALKELVKAHLIDRGLEVRDFGTDSTASCDYADFCIPAAKAVASGECDRGIVLCTTGIGASISANKVRGIRCALLSDLMSARLTRQHNDANTGDARPLHLLFDGHPHPQQLAEDRLRGRTPPAPDRQDRRL